MTMKENAVLFPPGLRFHPTDTEVLHYCLEKKIHGQCVPLPIPTLDVFGTAPWDLPPAFEGADRHFFRFTRRLQCTKNGKRAKRTLGSSGTRNGNKTWQIIADGGTVVGYKGFFTFQLVDKKAKGWLMHEYQLGDSKDSWECQGLVSCKIKNRKQEGLACQKKQRVMEAGVLEVGECSTYDDMGEGGSAPTLLLGDGEDLDPGGTSQVNDPSEFQDLDLCKITNWEQVKGSANIDTASCNGNGMDSEPSLLRSSAPVEPLATMVAYHGTRGAPYEIIADVPPVAVRTDQSDPRLQDPAAPSFCALNSGITWHPDGLVSVEDTALDWGSILGLPTNGVSTEDIFPELMQEGGCETLMPWTEAHASPIDQMSTWSPAPFAPTDDASSWFPRDRDQTWFETCDVRWEGLGIWDAEVGSQADHADRAGVNRPFKR